MKKISSALLSAVLILLCSCEKEIEFKGDYDGQKIVMYSTANTMDTLTVNVLRSYFILRTETGHDSVYRGLGGVSVTATVNGRPVPLREEETGFFRSDYVPEPGDEVTITASRQGYKPVSATTVVPKPASFSLEKVEIEEKPIYDEYWKDKRREWNVSLRIRINDAPDERNYYRLRVFGRNDNYIDNMFAKTKDVIFMNQGDDLEVLEGMIDGDNWVYLPELIDDSMIDGQNYAFDTWFEKTTFAVWEVVYTDDGNIEEEPSSPAPDLDPSEIWVEIDALSPDLYKYAKSVEDYEAAEYGMASFFGEKVSIHNNVQNGIGCVGAITPGIIYLGD